MFYGVVQSVSTYNIVLDDFPFFYILSNFFGFVINSTYYLGIHSHTHLSLNHLKYTIINNVNVYGVNVPIV